MSKMQLAFILIGVFVGGCIFGFGVRGMIDKSRQATTTDIAQQSAVADGEWGACWFSATGYQYCRKGSPGWTPFPKEGQNNVAVGPGAAAWPNVPLSGMPSGPWIGEDSPTRP